MGNRDHCPVCDSYTSELYDAFLHGGNCPYCRTSYETVVKLEAIKKDKARLKAEGVSHEIIQMNEDLKRQDIFLQEKLKKIEDGIWAMVVAANDFAPQLERFGESVGDIREEIKKEK